MGFLSSTIHPEDLQSNAMANASLHHIRIVLVEPAGPLNVGSIARVMKNLGLQQLVLVQPHCSPQDDLARQMAVHADDVLAAAQIVADLPQALAGCQRAIATTARSRTTGELMELPETALPWLLQPLTDTGTPPAAALIFGPEDRGLSNEELNYAQRYVRIPTSDIYPSLNLAQAVAICGYVLRRLSQGETTWAPSSPESPPAPPEPTAALDQIEQFLTHLEAQLLTVGYLYPHTCASRMEKFRRLLYRAAPNEAELAMLRGILRQVDWALKNFSADP